MTSMDSIPQGECQYNLGESLCVGVGYRLTQVEVLAALKGKISGRHHAINQREALKKELADLAGTEFDTTELEATLTSFAGMEPWRIGETFAECWLEAHRNCFFPWNTQFDIRSLKASLPGTDLVGLTRIDGDVKFAFGEVKTSGDSHTPPQVMEGKKGLKFQIGALRDSKNQRRQLIQNLGIRSINHPWFPDYKLAFAYHLKNKYRYWGMLLRDTTPNRKDLSTAIAELSSEISEDSPIELIALYIALKISEWPACCSPGGAA